MRSWLTVEWKTLRWALLPFVFLFLLGAAFFAVCEDGWCGGALRETVFLYLCLLLIVTCYYARLRCAGMNGLAAAGGAWVGAAGWVALLVALSQLLERDYPSALVAGAVGAGALAALEAYTLRSRRQG